LQQGRNLCHYRGEKKLGQRAINSIILETTALWHYQFLTARYRIPRKFLNKTNRFEAGSFVQDFRGIVSQSNYPASDKVDTGPAFDWERVVAGLES
jgi:hypothetical protein